MSQLKPNQLVSILDIDKVPLGCDVLVCDIMSNKCVVDRFKMISKNEWELKNNKNLRVTHLLAINLPEEDKTIWR